MVIVMGTESGIRETGSTEYDEEVLNAGWLACPDLQLQEVTGSDRRVRKARSAVDPDEFLRGVHRLQE